MLTKHAVENTRCPVQSDGRLCGDLYRGLFESSIGPSWDQLADGPTNQPQAPKPDEGSEKKIKQLQLDLVFKLSNT